MPRTAAARAAALLLAAAAAADDRLGPPKTLNGFFPFDPPKTKAGWRERRGRVREQTRVALGLYPTPPRTPLKPAVTGKTLRDGYTVENVYFASLPGHYVTGNLYRPTGDENPLRPGVLCPHGHWANGRFYDAGPDAAAKQISQGAESHKAAARHPLQARCVHLARMGCVVFQYDMVGYAESKAIAHRAGFTDAGAALRLHSFMGLQTWNSIRALDYLMSLPDVDRDRIGVTGASGGGTQTMILGAIDPRPDVIFPAVMVSTAMQGGCVCENCSYLRIGTGNVEFAGLFAPKPLGMTGANDWTVNIEKRGLPPLKKLYALYGVPEAVTAKCFPRFGHNYNEVSRGVMYRWLNQHLLDGKAATQEKPFRPIAVSQLAVFNEKHPRPADEKSAAGVRRWLTERDKKLLPKPANSKRFREFMEPVLRTMFGDLPAAGDVSIKKFREDRVGDVRLHRAVLARGGGRVPTLGVIGPKFAGTVTLWVHPAGRDSVFKDGKPTAAVRRLLDAGSAVLAFDCLGTGAQKPDKPRRVDPRYAGYTFGYNRPLVAERAWDVLTVAAFARGTLRAKRLQLVGWGEAGPWAVLAAAADGLFDRVAADLNRFRFSDIKETQHPMMLPGALKYGGVPAFAALAGREVLLHNAAGGKGLQDATAVVNWLAR